MARFSGKLGFIGPRIETKPGVWVDGEIVEKSYVGDMLRNVQFIESGNVINDNVNISNKISILVDPYAMSNYNAIRYIIFSGQEVKWKVSSVSIEPPRIIITLGGVYNGK